MHSTSTIYSDMNIKQLEGLAPTQPHREVDLTVVEADETGTCHSTCPLPIRNLDQSGILKTHIILPPTIYGIASGSLVDLKVQNSHSQQIPGLIKVSLDRRQGGMVGAGKNMWPNVHIDDGKNIHKSSVPILFTRCSRKIIHNTLRRYTIPNTSSPRSIRILLCRERGTSSTRHRRRDFPCVV